MFFFRPHKKQAYPTRNKDMDQLSKMMAWEEGELSDDDTIALFQELIDSGLAWKLQGCYGRMAKQLIEGGYCHD
jgi:hypothetical protein